MAGALHADIILPTQAPPQADPQEGRVWRGKQTTILLRGHSGGGGSLTFRIVHRPEHGNLSPVRLIGDNRAEIVYQNDGAGSVESDRFRYVVKSNDGRISSPAEVRILVEDVPARMVVPARIEFDEIEAGKSESRILAITNDGGGTLEGRLSVSAPWRLSDTAYRVGSARTENISVLFEPDEGRQFVGQITLTAANGIETIVQLTGAAISPVQVEPDHLEISGSNNDDAVRSGSVALTNQTGRVVTLRLEASSNIQSVSELTLAPHERRTVSIAVVPKWAGAFHEDIAFIGSDFRVRLPVDATAIAPVATNANSTPGPISTVQPAVTVNAVTSNKPLSSHVDASTASAAPRMSSGTFIAVKVKRVDASHWQLRWPQPTAPVTKYRIDERLVSLDRAGGLQTSWREIVPVETVALGKEVVAQIKGVEPKSRHLLRVTAFAPSGEALWESPVVALTPATASLRFQPPWLVLFGIALVVFVLLRWRANRRTA